MSDAEEYFRSLPPITRYYGSAVLLTTLGITLNLINPSYMYLDISKIIYNFQFWRLFTNYLCFGKFSMNFVFTFVLLIRYFRSLEEKYYHTTRGTADMLVMMVFGITVFSLMACVQNEGLYFLGQALVFYVLYIWSRKDPLEQVNVYGFTFSAWHFPFLLAAAGFLFGNSPLLDLTGILTGHLYCFLSDIIPSVYNKRLLWTPQFVYDAVEGKRVLQPTRPAWATQGAGYRLS